MTALVEPAEAPAGPGAYLLALRLEAPLALAIAHLGSPTLGPGTYLYAGSARGPGGIRARVARHARAKKRPHWHIDRLTMAARLLGVAGFPDRAECALIARLRSHPGVSVPVAGFGASDCRRCPAHLLRLAAGIDLAALLAILG